MDNGMCDGSPIPALALIIYNDVVLMECAAPKGNTKLQYDSAGRAHFKPWLKLVGIANQNADLILLRQDDVNENVWHPNENTVQRFAFHLQETHTKPGTYKSCMVFLWHAINKQLLLKGMPEKPEGFLYTFTAVHSCKKYISDQERARSVVNCEDIQVAFHIIVAVKHFSPLHELSFLHMLDMLMVMLVARNSISLHGRVIVILVLADNIASSS